MNKYAPKGRRQANSGVSPLWVLLAALIGLGAVAALLIAFRPAAAPGILVGCGILSNERGDPR